MDCDVHSKYEQFVPTRLMVYPQLTLVLSLLSQGSSLRQHLSQTLFLILLPLLLLLLLLLVHLLLTHPYCKQS